MTLMLAQGKPCFSSEALDMVRARFSAASPVSPYLSGTAGTPSHCRRHLVQRRPARAALSIPRCQQPRCRLNLA